MGVHLWSFAVWLCVAVSAVAWFMPIWQPGTPMAVQIPVAREAPAGAADWAPLWSGSSSAPSSLAAQPGVASRLRLVGVVAPQASRSASGVALIATEGNPAKAYRIGDVIDGEWRLVGIAPNEARVGSGSAAAVVTLSVPSLPPPATGQVAR